MPDYKEHESPFTLEEYGSRNENPLEHPGEAGGAEAGAEKAAEKGAH
jgi:hypothetical protein